jgi:hypothetical protein
LSANLLNEELFHEEIGLPLTDADLGAKSSFENLKSAKLIRVERMNEEAPNTITVRVEVNLQYSHVLTVENGEQSWDCSMVYESPQTGWKIEGFGRG